MSGSLTDYGENWALNIISGRASQAVALTPYIGILTVPPTDAGGGTEVPATGYSRKACGSAVFGSAAANAAIANTVAVDFGSFSTDAGSVVAVAIWDASSGGNMLAYSVIPVQLVKSGDPVLFPVGSIVLKLGGNLSVYGANLLLNLLTGRSTLSSALTTYLALYNVLPDASDAGGTEVSATGYARKALGATVFTSGASNGQLLSKVDVTVGPMTTAAGNITGAAIRDALTTGNLLLFCSVPVRSYAANDPCVYPAGSIALSGD
jgi:hypothetical protein